MPNFIKALRVKSQYLGRVSAFLALLLLPQLTLADALLVENEKRLAIEQIEKLEPAALSRQDEHLDAYLQVLETLLDPPGFLQHPEHLAPFLSQPSEPQTIDSEDKASLLQAFTQLDPFPFPYKPIHLYQLIRIARSLPADFNSPPVSAFAGTQVSEGFPQRLLDLGFPRQLRIEFPGGDTLPRAFYAFTNSHKERYVTFEESKLGAGWSKSIDLVYDLSTWSHHARALPNLTPEAPVVYNESENEKAILKSFAFEAGILRRLEKTPVGLLEVHDVTATQVIMKKYTCDLHQFIHGDAQRQIPAHPLSLNEKKHLFTQLLRGLVTLHGKCGVVHKDLKFQNILIDLVTPANPTGPDQSHASTSSCAAVLSDFGLSEDLTLYPAELPEERLQCGTEHWFAPEILTKAWQGKDREEKVRLAKKADVFSIGLALHGLFEGKKPAFTRVPFEKRKAAIQTYLRSLVALPTFTLTDGLYLFSLTTDLATRASSAEFLSTWEQVSKIPNFGQEEIKTSGRPFLRTELLAKLKDLDIQNFSKEEEAHRYLAAHPKAQLVLWPRSPSGSRGKDLAEIGVTLRQDLRPLRTKILRSVDPADLESSVRLNLQLLQRLQWLELPDLEDSSCAIL